MKQYFSGPRWFFFRGATAWEGAYGRLWFRFTFRRFWWKRYLDGSKTLRWRKIIQIGWDRS